MPRIAAASRRFQRVCCRVREIRSRSAFRAACRAMSFNDPLASTAGSGAGATAPGSSGDSCLEFASYRFVTPEHDRSLDQVLELAHIAGPMVLLEQRHRYIAK